MDTTCTFLIWPGAQRAAPCSHATANGVLVGFLPSMRPTFAVASPQGAARCQATHTDDHVHATVPCVYSYSYSSPLLGYMPRPHHQQQHHHYHRQRQRPTPTDTCPAIHPSCHIHHLSVISRLYTICMPTHLSTSLHSLSVSPNCVVSMCVRACVGVCVVCVCACLGVWEGRK